VGASGVCRGETSVPGRGVALGGRDVLVGSAVLPGRPWVSSGLGLKGVVAVGGEVSVGGREAWAEVWLDRIKSTLRTRAGITVAMAEMCGRCGFTEAPRRPFGCMQHRCQGRCLQDRRTRAYAVAGPLHPSISLSLIGRPSRSDFRVGGPVIMETPPSSPVTGGAVSFRELSIRARSPGMEDSM